MGYGARALQALSTYYNGEYFNVDETPLPETDTETSFAQSSRIDEV